MLKLTTQRSNNSEATKKFLTFNISIGKGIGGLCLLMTEDTFDGLSVESRICSFEEESNFLAPTGQASSPTFRQPRKRLLR